MKKLFLGTILAATLCSIPQQADAGKLVQAVEAAGSVCGKAARATALMVEKAAGFAWNHKAVMALLALNAYTMASVANFSDALVRGNIIGYEANNDVSAGTITAGILLYPLFKLGLIK